MPAKAGIQCLFHRQRSQPLWMPAFAGMTGMLVRVFTNLAAFNNTKTCSCYTSPMMMIPIEKRVLTVFILQVTINWLYVLWANAQPAIISSWIALSSLLGFIYFAFAIIAATGIYNKSRQGLFLSCAVVAFGMICAVVSYSEAFQYHQLGEAMIVPLIIINTCVIIYLAFHQHLFTK